MKYVYLGVFFSVFFQAVNSLGSNTIAVCLHRAGLLKIL